MGSVLQGAAEPAGEEANVIEVEVLALVGSAASAVGFVGGLVAARFVRRPALPTRTVLVVSDCGVEEVGAVSRGPWWLIHPAKPNGVRVGVLLGPGGELVGGENVGLHRRASWRPGDGWSKDELAAIESATPPRAEDVATSRRWPVPPATVNRIRSF